MVGWSGWKMKILFDVLSSYSIFFIFPPVLVFISSMFFIFLWVCYE